MSDEFDYPEALDQAEMEADQRKPEPQAEVRELKPCPFCGGDWIAPAALSDGNWYLCEDCGASSGSDGIDGWNARPIEDALRARAEAAEAELAALKAANRWIPVEERLPKTLQRVEVAFKIRGAGKYHRTLADYIAPRTVLAEDYLSDDCELVFADYEEETDRYWTPAGWYEFQEMAEMNYHIDETITHWRYLPEPPEVSE